MNRDELQAKFLETPVLTDLPDSKATEQMQDLLKHPGLPLLWGLLLGSKQAVLQALSQAPLSNMGEVSRAAVLQGTIKGIDLFYQTLLEQAVTSQEQERTDG